MAALHEIKRRIIGVKKTQQITRALKMVAAVKLRKAQQRIVQARPYAYRLKSVMGHVAAKIDRNLHPLLQIREHRYTCYVIVTADQGLCGSFNQNILRKAEMEIQKGDAGNIELILIGKKAVNFFKKQHFNIINEYTGIFKQLSFSQAVSVATSIRNNYLLKKFDRVYVIYNEFKSAAQQTVVIEQLLPIIPIFPEGKKVIADYIFEPDTMSILDILCPQNINVQLWRILLESHASEMGSRMMAMEYATENADQLINDLTIKYNKKRQENITNEILEIVSASEALKRSEQ